MRTKRVQAAGRVFRAVRDGVFFEIEHVKTCFVWQSSMHCDARKKRSQRSAFIKQPCSLNADCHCFALRSHS